MNNICQFGRWAFVEFTAVYEMGDSLATQIETLRTKGAVAA